MKRNIARLRLIIWLCALCLSVTIGVGVTPSAHAAVQAPQLQQLGNVQLDPYCQSLGYARAGLANSTYYGWRCLDAQGSAVATISMQSACQWQYNNNSVVDVTNNFYDASSAICYRINAYKGGVDVQGYCRAIGYVGVTTVGGSTAYDWSCVSSTGFLLNLTSMTRVCQWQYGFNTIVARFFNFYSTTSWQCWS
jgi:hypothetical protein